MKEIVMRKHVLVVVVVLSGSACNSRSGNAPAPVAAAATLPAPEPDRSPVALPVPAVPRTSRWELDPENSFAEFSCRHVLSKVRGMFPRPSGSVLLDEDTPANSRISATIDVASIHTGVEERDAHLKSAEFLDAGRYPAITFASTGVSRGGPTSYSVTGDLTIHGVTRPVTLAVTATPPFDHAGGIRRGIEATTSVNRKDFALRWEFPGEGAGVVVGDIIQITINAELVLKPEAEKGG